MSRPKPEILLESVDKKTYRSSQVLGSPGIYAIFYEGSPINLRNVNLLVNYPGPRYKKVSFPNRGHALNLCKRLNTKFRTDKFTVVLLTGGQQVYPESGSDTE
jgi:hypothetical protein